MHNQKTSMETLSILWNNYITLSESVDLDAMHPEQLEELCNQNATQRPFRIAAWLARQGFFVTAWNLWEFYGRQICQRLKTTVKKEKHDSTVKWISKSLCANSREFSDANWFQSANNLRNLITHSGAKINGSQGKKYFERAKIAFPNMELYSDGYLCLEHSHLCVLVEKIEDFFSENQDVS